MLVVAVIMIQTCRVELLQVPRKICPPPSYTSLKEALFYIRNLCVGTELPKDCAGARAPEQNFPSWPMTSQLQNRRSGVLQYQHSFAYYLALTRPEFAPMPPSVSGTP
jgi:hypothetical protein